MTFFGECDKEPERATCLKPLDLEDALQLQLMWSNFFVFGWSRNPWARAVSSYQYLLHAVKDLPQCNRVDWDTFCQDPLVFGELCRDHPECCPVFNHNFMWFHVVSYAGMGQLCCWRTETALSGCPVFLVAHIRPRLPGAK